MSLSLQKNISSLAFCLWYDVDMNAFLVPLHFTIKDWLILITASILVMCILEIRRLKKSITQEVRNRLIPQLILGLILDENKDAGGLSS